MRLILLTEHELCQLRRLGDVLITGSDAMPAFSAVPGIDNLLQVATRAVGRGETAIRDAIAAIPEVNDLQGAKAISENHRGLFELLSLLISGAYYMAREVLVSLDYPLERRNAAGVSDFADEYITASWILLSRTGAMFLEGRPRREASVHNFSVRQLRTDGKHGPQRRRCTSSTVRWLAPLRSASFRDLQHGPECPSRQTPRASASSDA